MRTRSTYTITSSTRRAPTSAISSLRSSATSTDDPRSYRCQSILLLRAIPRAAQPAASFKAVSVNNIDQAARRTAIRSPEEGCRHAGLCDRPLAPQLHLDRGYHTSRSAHCTDTIPQRSLEQPGLPLPILPGSDPCHPALIHPSTRTPHIRHPQSTHLSPRPPLLPASHKVAGCCQPSHG